MDDIVHQPLFACLHRKNLQINHLKIDFEFPDPNIYRTTIYCFPILVDKEGREYKSGRIVEEGLEKDFDPFDELNIYPTKRGKSLIGKIKNLFG